MTGQMNLTEKPWLLFSQTAVKSPWSKKFYRSRAKSLSAL